jgi:hypothetical protein
LDEVIDMCAPGKGAGEPLVLRVIANSLHPLGGCG